MSGKTIKTFLFPEPRTASSMPSRQPSSCTLTADVSIFAENCTQKLNSTSGMDVLDDALYVYVYTEADVDRLNGW